MARRQSPAQRDTVGRVMHAFKEGDLETRAASGLVDHDVIHQAGDKLLCLLCS